MEGFVRLSIPIDSQICVNRGQSQVRCTLIPGDGVGPEVSDAVQTVLQVQTVNDSPKVPRFLHQAMGARIDFEEMFFSEVLLAS